VSYCYPICLFPLKNRNLIFFPCRDVYSLTGPNHIIIPLLYSSLESCLRFVKMCMYRYIQIWTNLRQVSRDGGGIVFPLRTETSLISTRSERLERNNMIYMPLYYSIGLNGNAIQGYRHKGGKVTSQKKQNCSLVI
jgi:hypothetical protein